MHSNTSIPTGPRRLRILAAAAGLLALWLACAPSSSPVAASLDSTASPLAGQPIFLDVTVNAICPAPLPLELPLRLHSLAVLAPRPRITFAGLSPRGPLWRLRYRLVPTTLHPIPATTIPVGPLSVSMPAMHPRLPEPLPTTPVIIPPGPQAPPRLWILPCIAAPGLFLAAILARRRRNPLRLLRRLPVTPESLDMLPSLLAASKITRKDQPDFFHRLDLARFAQQPPPHALVAGLIGQAREILREKAP